ncbi:MAG: HAD-IIA family hydrolase [Propionibacteriaceae bacterium]|jgi:HAD superfamily hydrolase (TIGR01450 family)|nr:HAD-IIA family hydrolase [Propionibacteriaceae bacterium]
MTSRLADRYDVIGFDLDGVLYRGPAAVPGAAETLAVLRRSGIRTGFVTNNAQRSPAAVAEHLNRIGIAAAVDDVVTSAQATARLMAAELPAGAEVLVLGTAALAAEVRAVGLAPVAVRSPATAAVVVGFNQEQRWEDFNQGCYAVQGGARWYACNGDQTRPTDQGIAIGMGGLIAAMSRALPGCRPTMAGKPCRPLLDETARRLGAERLLFVGDRIDTDIEGAGRAGFDSLFVFSGSHGVLDLAAAGPRARPTWVGWDVRALLEAPRAAAADGSVSRCGAAVARARDGVVSLDAAPAALAEQLDGLRAVLSLLWAAADRGEPLDWAKTRGQLDLVP